MASKLSEILVAALAGPIQVVATEQLADLLRKIKPAETQTTILLTLYPAIDIELEKLTDQSRSKIDDAIIDAMKAAIETVAAEVNLTLPNNDGD